MVSSFNSMTEIQRAVLDSGIVPGQGLIPMVILRLFIREPASEKPGILIGKRP
jgi:hypothetical protein